MIENFLYNDIILYCKGWYQTPEGDTMLDDLSYLFSKIYAWTPKKEKDIALMMLRVLDEFDVKIGCHRSLYGFHSEIQKYISLYSISFDMAIIHYVRSILFEIPSKLIKLHPPKYGKKEHFRMGSAFHKYPISMSYAEMNRIASRVFKD